MDNPIQGLNLYHRVRFFRRLPLNHERIYAFVCVCVCVCVVCVCVCISVYVYV